MHYHSLKLISGTHILFRRYCSHFLSQSIIGRDFININNFTANELKCLLWTALDLKYRFGSKLTKVNSDSLDSRGWMITSMFHKPCLKNQLNIEKASQLTSSKSCIIIDENWESASSLVDTGRILSRLSNIIVASAGCNEQSLYDLAAGSSVPVINSGTPDSCPLTALGYALTILDYFGRMERLRAAWVGPSLSPTLGSLLHMLPKFRVHLYIVTKDCKHPRYLDEALKLASTYKSEVHHVEKVEQAIYKADVIITTSHPFKDLQINKKHLDIAAVNWIFLHDLPRTPIEVTDDVFYKRNHSLVWVAAENQFWILMAILLKTQYDYSPMIPAPSFSED